MNDYKTVVIGNSSVGKSSITKRFVDGKFDAQINATIGTAYLTKTIEVREKNITFQIWDTAGQETFRSLQKIYYKDSSIAILVYDITRRETFTSLQSWYEELSASTVSEKLVIALVGNKADMIDQEDVKYEEGRAFAKKINGVFLLTSAKTGNGIDELFQRIAEDLIQKEKEDPNFSKKKNDPNAQISLLTGEEKQQKKKKCCA